MQTVICTNKANVSNGDIAPYAEVNSTRDNMPAGMYGLNTIWSICNFSWLNFIGVNWFVPLDSTVMLFGLPFLDFMATVLTLWLIVWSIISGGRVLMASITNVINGTFFSLLKLYLIYWFHPLFSFAWIIGSLIVHFLNYMFHNGTFVSFLDPYMTPFVLCFLGFYTIVTTLILYVWNSYSYRLYLFVFVEYSTLLFLFLYTGGYVLLYGLIVSGLHSSLLWSGKGQGSKPSDSNSTAATSEQNNPAPEFIILRLRATPSANAAANGTGTSNTNGSGANKWPPSDLLSNDDGSSLDPSDYSTNRPTNVQGSGVLPGGMTDNVSREAHTHNISAITPTTSVNSDTSGENDPGIPSLADIMLRRIRNWGSSQREVARSIGQATKISTRITETAVIAGLIFSTTRPTMARGFRSFVGFMSARNHVLLNPARVPSILHRPTNLINRTAHRFAFGAQPPHSSTELWDYWTFSKWVQHTRGTQLMPQPYGNTLYRWVSLHLSMSVVLSPVTMWVLMHIGTGS